MNAHPILCYVLAVLLLASCAVGAGAAITTAGAGAVALLAVGE
jgi:hypothetical protein